MFLTFNGSAFHSIDPATENVQRQNYDYNLEMQTFLATAERRWKRPGISLVSIKRFLMYSGLLPLTAARNIRQSLNLILNHIGSQFRAFMHAGDEVITCYQIDNETNCSMKNSLQ